MAELGPAMNETSVQLLVDARPKAGHERGEEYAWH
jgi:hypothetical protein